MPKMRELTPVDADFALIGPNQNTLRQPIAVSAATLFKCLADGPAWKEWLGIDVEWTTPGAAWRWDHADHHDSGPDHRGTFPYLGRG